MARHHDDFLQLLNRQAGGHAISIFGVKVCVFVHKRNDGR